jgi:hypothetical protein
MARWRTSWLVVNMSGLVAEDEGQHGTSILVSLSERNVTIVY